MAKRFAKPELLAPAGNEEALMAAIEAGADAMYFGLTGFNVRDRAANFNYKKLDAYLPWLRSRGKRTYLVFNAILKDTEMNGALRAISLIEHLPIDALIVTDLGLIRLIRRHFPHLALHGSTQLSVTNLDGIKRCADLGLERVILARELTLEELEGLCAESPIELEIFCHGALCFSYGGQCLISSYHGGRSANRGRCTQACRRLFTGDNVRSTVFSAGDLDTLKYVDRFEKMGIASLKIEGRQRSAEYVFKAVSAYRKMLDAPPSARDKVLGEARRLVAHDMGRKKGPGHLTDAEGQNIVLHGLNTATGIYLGRLFDEDSEARERVKKGGKGKRGPKSEEKKSESSKTAVRQEVMITSPVRLRKGDRLRVQALRGHAGSGFKLLRFEEKEARIRQRKAWTYKLPLPEWVEARAGDHLYKVAHGTFERRLHNWRKRAEGIRGEFRAIIPLTVKATVTETSLRLRVEDSWGWSAERVIWVQWQPGKNDLTQQTAAKYLGRARDYGFDVRGVELEFEPGCDAARYLPPKEFKQLRRDFFAELREVYPGRDEPRTRIHPVYAEFKAAHATRDRREPEPPRLTLKVPRCDSATDLKKVLTLARGGFDEVAVPLFADGLARIEREELEAGVRKNLTPALPIIIQPGDLPRWRDRVQKLVGAGHKRWLLGHFSQQALFSAWDDVELVADIHFNIMNGYTIEHLAQVGYAGAWISAECDRKQIAAMASLDTISVGVMCYGAPPVFFARMHADIGKKRRELAVTSEYNETYTVRRDHGFTWVHHERPMSLFPFVEELAAAGVRMLRIDLRAHEFTLERVNELLAAMHGGAQLPQTTDFNYVHGID